MVNLFLSKLITLQEMARFILKEADGNEKMLQWLQEIYPYITISDANKEKALMEKLIEANSYYAGLDIVNRLHSFHKSLADKNRDIGNRKNETSVSERR